MQIKRKWKDAKVSGKGWSARRRGQRQDAKVARLYRKDTGFGRRRESHREQGQRRRDEVGLPVAGLTVGEARRRRGRRKARVEWRRVRRRNERLGHTQQA